MAHRSRASKPKIIHTDKLFGGRETAMDVHRKLAWNGAHCYVCGSGETVVRISYGQSPFDLMAHEPGIASQLIMASEDQQLPVWQSKYGPMVWFWAECVCSQCRTYAEREAAKLPSYILVEMDNGPGQDKVIVQVPRASMVAS